MSTNDVKSARRVLDILQFFAATRAPATLSQLSAGLGIPKSSCLALLDTLEGDGYAHQTAGRYYLTRRWLNEARTVAEHDQLTTRIRPTLEALRDELDETLILAQRSGDQVVYLDVAEPERIVRFTARVGQQKPLHASASGRALLGAMPPAEREALVARLPLDRYTSKTVKTHKQLLQLIDSEARRGWHVNLAEHQADTLSVAAPLVLYGAVLALVVGAPLDRSASRADLIGQTLRAAGRELTQRLDSPAPAVTAY
ncbi:IclR family transcriptional regulator [Achromobacter sp. K91]|uniref:IclR family transcriptional regulator n=1 Tax=Achromobacter sp. K91 TaxID=2292262 RepID=UPI000E661CB3|nr:IclR family transcriptional regulator [Achromobacter sp. K91]RIJ03410.1 IclR family transcriptional regulator [Achromobacter sp. K91]